ncbi:glycosyltransferase [Paenibacillus sp. N3.4]|uniref:glycosyltransferase n=1 Tax=Paenibacillus sp. N3.4 TaxID=2603222 RepID=UPI0011CB8ED5|nr:glycosyltransferase [Paenibacillus sp. N3.4]TXK76915.1 glycosyltransferase [Paenibacillus sp. N3.4]
MTASFPFDHYQRYKHAAEVINKWKNSSGIKKIRILEVGANEHKNLELFLADDDITYLDIQLPDHLKFDSSYIQGDATEMPFSDNEYDWVIALDVFEHINNDRKQAFLLEMNRVGKHGFLMSAPFNTPGVAVTEKSANTFFHVLYGEDYRWLKEHEELGLPELDETLDFLIKREIPFIHFGHGSLAIWEMMMSTHFLVAGKFALRPYCTLIDDVYNQKIYSSDYADPHYRQFIVSVKDSGIIETISNWISGRKHQDVSQDALDEISTLYEKLKILHQNISDKDRNENYNGQFQHLAGVIEQQVSHSNLVFENIRNQNTLLDGEIKDTYKLLNDEMSQRNLLLREENRLQNELLSKEINEMMLKVTSIESKVSNLERIKEENEIAKSLEIQKNLEHTIEEQKNNYLRTIEEFREILGEKDHHISNLQIMAESLRIKNRIKRALPNTIKKPLKKIYRILKLIKNNPHYLSRGLFELRRRGIKGLTEKVAGVNLQQEQPPHNYQLLDQFDREAMVKELEKWPFKPLVTVLMPVYNVSPKWLGLAIESVQAQIYDNWQLVIVDDCSTNQETKDYLNKVIDSRIHISFLKNNLGIAGATNEAAALGKGEYFCLLDNDDELRPHALFEMVKALQLKMYDLLYSDEDKIDVHGVRKNPFHKPDWSPDLLRCQMYMGHLIMFKKSLFEQVGGYKTGFDGAQDYDLILRMTESVGCSIHHVPKILYSWRELSTSTAINPDSKPYAQHSGLKAVNEHLARVFGEGNAWAEETEYLYVYDSRFRLTEPKPKVSIIIPTKDKIDLLEPCIQSIISVTTYSDYEIIILDNNSELKASMDWFSEIQEKYTFVKVIEAKYEFNWSKLNNHGIDVSTGEVLVFLNNDTVVLTSDWLSRLAEKTLQSGVGTVGALLLFEDRTIQHAGVVIGMGGWADHVFKGQQPIHYGSPFISPAVIRNVSASTGACLAISRKTINKVGPFDEDFIICGSDVEISIRATNAGLFNIYDPKVVLYHYESKTRTSFVPEQDFKMSALHYGPYLKNGDPFYNSNLSLNHLIPTTK